MRILVLEDEAVLRDDLVARLIERGYDVRGVGTLAEAIATGRHWQPYLVLADVHVPDARNGKTIADLRAALGGACEIIVCTAYEWNADTYAVQGVVGYLPKPFHWPLLLHDVGQARVRWERDEKYKSLKDSIKE